MGLGLVRQRAGAPPRLDIETGLNPSCDLAHWVPSGTKNEVSVSNQAARDGLFDQRIRLILEVFRGFPVSNLEN